MKYLISFLISFLLLSTSYAQLSLVKDINLQEAGSNPANFNEVNGTVFFTVETADGFRLWKTDGTSIGTQQVSDLKVNLDPFFQSIESLVKDFYISNNELYFFAYGQNINEVSLWKTDGFKTELVKDNFYKTGLYFLNHGIYFVSPNGNIAQIVNNSAVIIKEFPISEGYTLASFQSINNSKYLFVFAQYSFNGTKALQIWRCDGTSSGTTKIKSIDNSYLNSTNSNKNQRNTIVTQNDKVYFVLNSAFQDNLPFPYTALWVTEGEESNTVKIKAITSIIINPSVINLETINNNLLFFTGDNTLWFSDGTTNGTQDISQFNYLDTVSKGNCFSYLNGKYYFTARAKYENELWQTDGTASGTSVLKYSNVSTSSNPYFYTVINNKLYFKANNTEWWESDGTKSGTRLIETINQPAFLSKYDKIFPEHLYSPTLKKYFFSNYTDETGYELWSSDDGTRSNKQIVKNINTLSSGSLVSSIKVKMGKYWYFNAQDERGIELWKTDGTANGTELVKEIGVGQKGFLINEMVSNGTTIFFTGYHTDSSSLSLWKSDGTSLGTQNIPLNSSSIYLVAPSKLIIANNKLFFIGFKEGLGKTLWVSDGTETGTHIVSNKLDLQLISEMCSVENKLFFNYAGSLWVTDGTTSNTINIFNNEIVNAPYNPIHMIEFNNKIYFFATYYDLNLKATKALYESDGTRAGTKIIKEFGFAESMSYESGDLIIDKTDSKLFFLSGNSITGQKYYNLWVSDGSTIGTIKLQRISFTGSGPAFKTLSNKNQLLIALTQSATGSQNNIQLLVSDGTASGTHTILNKYSAIPVIPDLATYNNKFYFRYYDNQLGWELWNTDGTIQKTKMVGEVYVGSPSSYNNSLMPFDDKIIFWAEDGIHGRELWQYVESVCNGTNICIPIQWRLSKSSN